MSGEVLVRCSGAGRTYGRGATATVALQEAHCEVREDARVALTGPSGSGKSTLIHLMAGLETPTSGTVEWPAIGSRAELRPGPVAIVFQGPSLLPPLTVLENAALPLLLDGVPADSAEAGAAEALGQLGVGELARKLPEEISGGQAQRAAVARALAGSPRLILADEPTGQLDHDNAVAVVDALLAAADRAGASLVVATHDPLMADRFPERWEMAGGRLFTKRPVAA